MGNRIVFLPEESVFGELLHEGAYYSLVKYSVGGIMYEEYLENDEFIIWRDYGIEYIEE